MRKLIFLSLSVLAFISCNKENKSETKNEIKYNYTVSFNAVYPESDSIVVVYKKDTYFQYEKKVVLPVKGSPNLQNLSLSIPDNGLVENLEVTVSTNKSQKQITLQNIMINNNGKLLFNVINQGQGLTDYFDLNAGMSLENKEGLINLSFAGEYPPGMTGNKNLEDKFLQN